MVFVTFKQYKGVYFWSLLITAFSIILYSFGAWGKLVSISTYDLLPVSFVTWGWVVMVVGQSIVLWSRLHLITQNEKLLKGVLWGIIINSFLMGVPTIIMIYVTNATGSQDYAHGYSIMERIQMTAFSTQELLISAVYLREVRQLLGIVYQDKTRKLMWELVAINVTIIILDIALLSVEFINLYEIQITLKGMVYSIKLKLEFGVLSKLVKIIRTRKDSAMEIFDESKHERIVGLARLAPVHSRNTMTTLGTSRTLGNDSSGPNGNVNKRSDSISKSGFFTTRSRDGGVMALDILKNEYGFTPEHLEEARPRQRHSRASSTSDLYPGRLIS